MVDRRDDLIAPAAEGFLETGDELFVAFGAFLVLISDEEARPWPGNADHLIYGGFLIVKKVDPADVENAIEN
jgi:hypothetical protein